MTSVSRAPAATTPREAGFSQPAEWALHEACWIAWPSHEDLWGAGLEPVRDAWVEMARAIGEGERLEVLVPDAGGESLARERLAGLDVRLHRIPFGDIWLRDTAPVFLTGPSGERACACFEFNGWGEKYVLPHDAEVSAKVAAASSLPTFRLPFILEGGSVETDGEGTCLTTRQCLLNPNRNPGMTAADVETSLRDALGVERILWLGEGLRNDHTDGHIDTIARFVAPASVVCMRPSGPDDPNGSALTRVEEALRSFRDAGERRLEVTTIPSPGRVLDPGGEVLPASYLNFYVGNRAVVVPVFGVPTDAGAIAAIGRLFRGRKAVGVPACDLLTGGGAFHCITQQVPA